MFLSIQHPGEETSVKGGVYGQPATYTSYWPRGNKTTGTNPSDRTGVPDGASLEVDPARAAEPFPGLVVVPFQGHGFPRLDFVGEAELHLVDGKVARVVFRAP
jgi:hypothetical protein